MTPLPVRLAAWVIDSLAALPEAVFPINTPTLCRICGRATRVQPCTLCMYAADQLAGTEAEEEVSEPPTQKKPRSNFCLGGCDCSCCYGHSGGDCHCLVNVCHCGSDRARHGQKPLPEPSAASAADSSATIPPAADERPADSPTESAGHPTSDTAALIAGVLSEWHPWEQWDGSWRCSVDAGDYEFDTLEAWQTHTSHLIAERIEKNAPPSIETGHDIGLSWAAETFPQHNK